MENSFNEIKNEWRKKMGAHHQRPKKELHFFQKKLTFPTLQPKKNLKIQNGLKAKKSSIAQARVILFVH